MINKHVVARYHTVVTCRYNEVHILQVPCIGRHFVTQVGTMSTGGHTLRILMTADPRLHIAVDTDLRSKSIY